MSAAASTNETRKLIGKSRTLTSRADIHQTADGLEIETFEQYEVVQRRVLFDDVLMVSIHREVGVAYLVVTGLIAAFFLTITILILNANTSAWPAAIVPGIIGVPAFIGFLLRISLGVDIVTIFGRRSAVSLRFTLRKRRAREVYGAICATVRSAHRKAERLASPPQQQPEPMPEPAEGQPE